MRECRNQAVPERGSSPSECISLFSNPRALRASDLTRIPRFLYLLFPFVIRHNNLEFTLGRNFVRRCLDSSAYLKDNFVRPRSPMSRSARFADSLTKILNRL